MTNDGGVVSGSSGQDTSVTSLGLDVADNGTFGEGSEGQDVSDGQSSLLSTVDELTSVHTLGSDEGLGSELVAVWVSEGNESQGSTSGGW